MAARAGTGPSSLAGDEFAGLPAVFAPEGRAPQVGEVWRNPEMARTLRLIAETNGPTPSIAARSPSASWISPRAPADSWRLTIWRGTPATGLSRSRRSYRGYDVWEMPPSTQGLAVLLALNILEGYELSFPRDSVDSFHRQLEAMKLAFADVHHFVADPTQARVPVN